MSLHNHRPPRQRSVLGGLRGDIELTHHQIKVILQALEEASVDSLAKSLGGGATPGTVQHVIASLQDPLDAMDCWLDEHWDWLHRKWPYEKDPSEEGMIPVTTEGPRCRWCQCWVHDCDKKPEQCLGASIRNKPEVNDG